VSVTRSLRGLVFDFDGLICDTETSLFEVAHEIYREHGVELSRGRWLQGIGTHGRHWLADLEDEIGPLDNFDALVERRRFEVSERLLVEGALPGVADFTARAVDAGLALAVASSSSVLWVTDHLERLGLLGRFSAISTSEEGVPAKPEPEVYRRALKAIGVDATDAAAFEDSPNGIAAAKAAGLFCVAVPNRMTTSLDLSAADMVVESFLDFDLDLLRW
jgi:beta-phosphoglucomutase-like phosphatase (HAD superfamily)